MSTGDIIDDITGKLSADGGVDYLQLNTGLELVSKISSVILGLLSMMIMMVVPIVVVLELIYINVPTIRDKIDDVMIRGTGVAMNALKFTLRDASKAVEEANTTKTGRSANYVYLCLKVKWIFIVVFAVAMVVGGGPVLINVLIKLLSGIIRVITRAIG